MKKVSKKNNFVKILIIILVLLAVPITVYLVQRNQESRSSASGYNDSRCIESDGVCLGNSQNVKEGDSCKVGDKDGEYVFGLCGGGRDRRCCVPIISISDDDGDSPNRLKVATFNIGNARKTSRSNPETLAAEIKKHGFDIVGLQESKSGLSNDIKNVLRKDSPMDSFHTSVPAGITTLSKKNLSNTISKDIGPCNERRAIQKSTIKVNNKDVSFYNVHLDYHSSCRKKQALDVIDLLKKDPNPYILVGDFNFGRSACSTSDSIFKDDHEIIYDSNLGTRCTDMIMYSKNRGIKKVSSKTYYTRGKLSDHNIVSAIFEIN